MTRSPLEIIPGSVTSPRGFSAAAVFSDIKRLGTGKGSDKGNKRDLAIVLSHVPAVAAGMFTTNQVCAAPVKVSLAHLRRGRAQAIIANSGNANACTGARGLRDARTMARCTAAAFQLAPEDVLVASTGRIGVPLPMKNMERGIAALRGLVSEGPESSAAVAEAIMTSDTRPKALAVEFSLGRVLVRLGGVCKGAGMIQPGMSPTGRRPASMAPHATMLAFLTTDAAIAAGPLRIALRQAVSRSFNRITVDGDMSTNDSVMILANGMAGNAPIRRAQEPAFARFQEALDHLTLELAKMVVRDGEGVSRFVTVRVYGARTPRDADACARAVANSTLVRTSWCGGDPNWGRILDACGYSSASVTEEKVDVAYSLPGSSKRLFALRRGQPSRTPFRALCDVVAAKEFDLHIFLNLGKAGAVIYAADLTEAYVDFNKGDVSDPASLGG